MRLAALVGLAIVLAGCGSRSKPIAVEPLAEPGKTLSLTDFKGKVVLLDFWATWCGPCRENMPHISELHNKYRKDGLEVIALSEEDRNTVAAFINRFPIDYPIFLDAGGTFQAYGVQTIPHAVVIGRDGDIRYEGHPGEGGLEGAIKSALEQKTR